MKDEENQKWREFAWRRRVDASEEAELQRFLAAHPEVREDFQSEAELNHSLDRIPEAPRVSSNFTALVMREIERESASDARNRPRVWTSWRAMMNFLPKAAVAALILSSAVLGYHEHE